MERIDNKQNIIRLCRRARRLLEISQETLAKNSNFTQSRISQFENGYYSSEIANYYFNNVLSDQDKEIIEQIGGIE